MINKNEWSLATYSEKDINLKILNMVSIEHTEEDFVKMLSSKESFER